MKVGILTHGGYRSPRLLAEGLVRMLSRLGVEHELFLDGVDWLAHPAKQASPRLPSLTKPFAARRMRRRLESCDLFVISWYTPNAFYADFDLAPLRALGRPILQYAVYSLGGAQYWLERLPKGSTEKYDGYLVASAIHNCPVASPKPVFQIGLDLKAAQPFVGRRDEFLVMFDFRRPGYESERELQWAAVTDLGIKTVELSGEYTFSEIEAVYARTCLGFVAFFEAFGVPIVQLQYYGAKVASPTREWVSRHALGAPGTVVERGGSMSFSSNFLFYDGYSDLKNKLNDMVNDYDAASVRAALLDAQPHFVSGDLATLWSAIRAYI